MSTLSIDFDGGTDGVEVSDFDTNSNIPVYDDAGAVHGAMAMLCDGLAADYGVISTSMPSTPAEGWWRFYGRLSAAPGGNTGIVEFRKAAASQGAELQLNTSAQIRIRDDSAILQGTTTASLNTDGAPWRVEVRVLSHATAGEVEVRMFVGSNYEGTTPDETELVTGIDTGDGTLHSFAIGWITTPTGSPDLHIDSLVFSDEGWIGPVATAATPVPYWGVLHAAGTLTGGYSAILEPPSGAWLGATVAAADASTSSTTAGLTLYNSMSGIRAPQIIGIYKVGNWDGTFTAAELAMLADSGGGDKAIPHVRWKVGNTGSANSWASVAAGDCDTVLDAAFTALAAWGGKIFITIYHEPEDNAGPANYSDTDFANMWIQCHDRGAAQGATNLIWVPNFMGFYGHITHVINMLSGIVGYFDWVAQDPYAAETASRDTLAELLNWDPFNNWGSTGPGYDGFYDYVDTVYPGVPQMLAEWGIDGGSNSAHGVISAAAAIPIIEEYATSLASFPALKALEYWHADGIGDYQWTDRGGTGVTEYVAFTNNSYFDQDTAAAYD